MHGKNNVNFMTVVCASCHYYTLQMSLC